MDVVYGSARKSYLQMLDPIHNQGLRLCLETFRTSVESLYIDAHEPSLGARRAKLHVSLQYATKMLLHLYCKAEKQNINFSYKTYDVYNRPFSLEELQDAHDTSAGPDKIQLLKHLPHDSCSLLINILK